ncbi:hypothetical protein SAMN04489724_3783 [Algoriphagus locisalis]|uniref:Uncharacterized protein n=1 Tax=Algoriphagus locisalis TaxID=305507 RepID=A0A1I7D9D1_9BACT|nr:hypothetical protein [Algoriphagus locisalis]SFU08194.1 hypothetical protein SAMN04489724_3783 [Algoriphagus locisalis]
MITVIKKGSDKRMVEKALSRVKIKKNFDAQKYCGALNLKEDPQVIQKALRDEWK